ncbi:MAG: DUF166 family protein [Candidatus Lokiarchaeota archaeon]
MRLAKNLIIGLISDGKYGERAYENFKNIFETEWILVPDIPATVILDEELELNIPECDLYVSYVRHPDIILQIAEHGKPLILGITPGIGLYQQAKQINPKVISPRTMCSLEPNTGIPEIDEFAHYFGKPQYQITMDNKGTVEEVRVLRSSPCGSSQAGANFFKNKALSVQNLQDLALNVCHECRAPRFGHTCDKEISGIIHILSFLRNFEGKVDLELNNDLKIFAEKIKKEYEMRIHN